MKACSHLHLLPLLSHLFCFLVLRVLVHVAVTILVRYVSVVTNVAGSFPIGSFPGMQNRTRLRFPQAIHRQTGLYHQQCSPHTPKATRSTCHSTYHLVTELLLLRASQNAYAARRHHASTSLCDRKPTRSRHRVGLCTLNACTTLVSTSRRARGEGRPRGRIPPRGIALLACGLRCLWVGCDALFAAVRAAHACRWTAKRLCGCAGSPCVGTTGGLAISSIYTLR